MLKGYSTLAAVTLELIRHNNSGRLRCDTKHTLAQAIEQVIWRKKSLAAQGSGTSYVWWWFHFDCGELAIEWDGGNLAEVPTGPRRHRYVPLRGDHFEADKLVDEWMGEWRAYSNEDTLTRLETTMIQMGLQPYQKCLSTYSEFWSTDYYGESDCDLHCELLYVEPAPSRVIYLPMMIDEGFIVPEMKGFRLA